MEVLALYIGVHPKGLQRTLARLGTSFQELRDKVRRDKAMEMLAGSKRASNEEIADALGFASASSFSRVFKGRRLRIAKQPNLRRLHKKRRPRRLIAEVLVS
ncbi:helix-turn-helix domain-containing protein [Cribrihabitans sp. XS_ASV171]